MNTSPQSQQTQGFPAKASHVMSQVGHWLVMLPVALHFLLGKVHEITPELSGTLQIVTLVMGAGWVAGILHSALMQKALAGLEAAQKGADNVSQLMQGITQAIAQVKAQASAPPSNVTKIGGAS